MTYLLFLFFLKHFLPTYLFSNAYLTINLPVLEREKNIYIYFFKRGIFCEYIKYWDMLSHYSIWGKLSTDMYYLYKMTIIKAYTCDPADLCLIIITLNLLKDIKQFSLTLQTHANLLYIIKH